MVVRLRRRVKRLRLSQRLSTASFPWSALIGRAGAWLAASRPSHKTPAVICPLRWRLKLARDRRQTQDPVFQSACPGPTDLEPQPTRGPGDVYRCVTSRREPRDGRGRESQRVAGNDVGDGTRPHKPALPREPSGSSGSWAQESDRVRAKEGLQLAACTHSHRREITSTWFRACLSPAWRWPFGQEDGLVVELWTCGWVSDRDSPNATGGILHTNALPGPVIPPR